VAEHFAELVLGVHEALYGSLGMRIHRTASRRSALAPESHWEQYCM
jgi:hypothetical protein